jgi:quercetin dioxygenase-like cupin family protein
MNPRDGRRHPRVRRGRHDRLPDDDRPRDYILRENTVQPCGSTGWHYHDGTLHALVKAGTLTHTDSDCTTTVVHRTGQTFTEPSGADHVHIGRNLGTTPVVLEVLYVDPAGSPLAEDAPAPSCSLP